jgi:hypothetical protein
VKRCKKRCLCDSRDRDNYRQHLHLKYMKATCKLSPPTHQCPWLSFLSLTSFR